MKSIFTYPAIGGFSLTLCLLVSANSHSQETAPETDTPPDSTTTEKAGEDTLESDAGRQTAMRASLVLKVINPVETRRQLRETISSMGGFPVHVTDQSMTLKVPPAQLTAFLEAAKARGMVLEKSISREDLTQQIAVLEGQLASKIKILQHLRGFFDDSDFSATLHIEQTMTSLVHEIESVKGELRVQRERARWAVIDLSFQFQQRDRLLYVASPFEWLNTVSLPIFLEEFSR